MTAEADPLMPDSENMRTYISSSGDAVSKAASKELNRIHQHVEDNLSTIGEEEGSTRLVLQCSAVQSRHIHGRLMCSLDPGRQR